MKSGVRRQALPGCVDAPSWALRLDTDPARTYTPSLTSTHMELMASDRRPGGTVRLVVRGVLFPDEVSQQARDTNRGFLLRRSVLQSRYWMTFGHGTGRQGVGQGRSIPAIRRVGTGKILEGGHETGGFRCFVRDRPSTHLRGPVQSGRNRITSLPS